MPTFAFNGRVLPIFSNRKDADPQEIGEQLEIIAKAHKGRLTPLDVVTAAKPTAHPLHKHFEWRDKVAAEAFRRDQARGMIRSIHIVREDEQDSPDGNPPAFLSIADNGFSYRTVSDVLKSPALQLQVLKQAERDLRAFERRYRQLVDICDLVRGARERLSSRISEVESRPEAAS